MKPKLLNVAVKITFFGLVAYIATHMQLPQFQGKGMVERLWFYPVAAGIVPGIWVLKRRKIPYPHAADALILLPFVIDFAGNVFNLFDTVEIFDDIAHFLNWIILVSGFAVLLPKKSLSALNVFALCVGFGPQRSSYGRSSSSSRCDLALRAFSSRISTRSRSSSFIQRRRYRCDSSSVPNAKTKCQIRNQSNVCTAHLTDESAVKRVS